MASFRTERGLVGRPGVKVGTREDGIVEIELHADGLSITMVCDDPSEADTIGLGLIGANAIGKAMRRTPVLDARGDDAARPLYEPKVIT